MTVIIDMMLICLGIMMLGGTTLMLYAFYKLIKEM